MKKNSLFSLGGAIFGKFKNFQKMYQEAQKLDLKHEKKIPFFRSFQGKIWNFFSKDLLLNFFENFQLKQILQKFRFKTFVKKFLVFIMRAYIRHIRVSLILPKVIHSNLQFSFFWRTYHPVIFINPNY
jgi:hypothetical protein